MKINPPYITDNSVTVTDSTFSSKNMRYTQIENIEIQLKNLLSFDFKDEKYNIISSSPISTPKELEKNHMDLFTDLNESNLKNFMQNNCSKEENK